MSSLVTKQFYKTNFRPAFVNEIIQGLKQYRECTRINEVIPGDFILKIYKQEKDYKVALSSIELLEDKILITNIELIQQLPEIQNNPFIVISWEGHKLNKKEKEKLFEDINSGKPIETVKSLTKEEFFSEVEKIFGKGVKLITNNQDSKKFPQKEQKEGFKVYPNTEYPLPLYIYWNSMFQYVECNYRQALSLESLKDRIEL